MHTSPLTSRFIQPALRIAGVTALALALSACGESSDNATLGQKLDSAIAQTEKKADELGQRAENTLDHAQTRAESALDSAQARASEAAADARSSVEQAADKLAEQVDDAAITANVKARLAGDPELSALKIDVDTQDGKVKLSGPAPSEAARARAAELAASIKGVVGIDNQIVVAQS
ncbi:BON domain-containing protein [Methyloversatilis thermotolerans]|uniref:BON domain-containing protein n=1 Tax=Methyloversatilis thermotolerans TaxID=1346290 RepID=UPI00036694F3|nr:BON domain-containing protein [Methyloversatilis thermotolerans]